MRLSRAAGTATAALACSALLGLGTAAPAFADDPVSPPPPDKDCDQVSATNFQVSEGDPHNFDADGDGIGCETDAGGAPAEDEEEAIADNDDEATVETAPSGGVATGGGGAAGDGINYGLIGAGSAFVVAAAGGAVVTRRLRRDS